MKRRSQVHRFIQDLRDAGVREVTLVLEDGQTKRRRIGFVVEHEGDLLDGDGTWEDEPTSRRVRKR